MPMAWIPLQEAASQLGMTLPDLKTLVQTKGIQVVKKNGQLSIEPSQLAKLRSARRVETYRPPTGDDSTAPKK